MYTTRRHTASWRPEDISRWRDLPRYPDCFQSLAAKWNNKVVNSIDQLGLTEVHHINLLTADEFDFATMVVEILVIQLNALDPTYLDIDTCGEANADRYKHVEMEFHTFMGLTEKPQRGGNYIILRGQYKDEPIQGLELAAGGLCALGQTACVDGN